MTYFSRYTIRGLRQAINKNSIYAWMAVFIILSQAFLLSGPDIGTSYRTAYSVDRRREFRIETDKRQDAIKELLQKDDGLAHNLGVIFALGLCVLLIGSVSLASYAINKLKGKETLPRTLDTPEALWSAGDVLRAAVFLIFFHRVFSIAAYALEYITAGGLIDRRIDMTISTLAMDTMIFLFVLRVVRSRHKQGIGALGLSTGNIIVNVRSGLYLYIASLPVLIIVFLSVVRIAGSFDYLPPPQPAYELIFKEQRPVILLLISLLIALIGPFVEEVFFRGFLYGAFRKTVGTLKAVLLSSFLFAFLHASLLGFAPIMVLGVLFAYLRERTGSLIPSITAHIVHNSVLAVMMFFLRGLTA
jgi:uncharacterized protein